MSDRVRLTISVTPEVQEVFQRMAEASGLSLGKCMGDWLADTVEGAQFVTQKMVQAKQAPRLVMREMQGFAHGLAKEVDQALADMRTAGKGGGRRPPGRAQPPSSNTGVNLPARKRAKP